MFNIGDVVYVDNSNSIFFPAVREGEMGVVISTDYKGIRKDLAYGVEFFERNDLRHTLGGLCEEGRGYWMLPEDLKLYEPSCELPNVAERDVDQEGLIKILEGDETHV